MNAGRREPGGDPDERRAARRILGAVVVGGLLFSILWYLIVGTTPG